MFLPPYRHLHPAVLGARFPLSPSRLMRDKFRETQYVSRVLVFLKYHLLITTSTRLFISRPISVSLEARGAASPQPRGVTENSLRP